MHLFPPWRLSHWDTVDDRVRGGRSVSHLEQHGDGVVFKGTLDIATLGGAGFASQRYCFPNGPISLPSPEYTGVRINLDPFVCSPHAPTSFTFILTTTPTTHRPHGRVKSRVNWEATFTDSLSLVELPFREFVATYRGRAVEPAPKFDTSAVFDISIMCRSAFGRQAGKFELPIQSIEAICRSK